MGQFPVTIGVLTFNRLAYTRQCLESIAAHTHTPYHLSVLDNASTDGTARYLKLQAKAGVIHELAFNRVNRGLSNGKNYLVRQAMTPLVCILDNDFLVHDGWLEAMLKVLESDHRIMAVSPYSAMPSHHPDAVLDRFEVAGLPVVELDRLGGCMLIRRKDYMAAGGMVKAPNRKMHFASTPFWHRLRARYPGRKTVTLGIPLADHMDELDAYRSKVAGEDSDCYLSWNKLQKKCLALPPFEEWKKAVVDVVIPVYGALHLLELCLEGLKRNTHHAYRPLLVSDKPDEHEAVEAIGSRYGVPVLRNETNLGFPASCNRGWRAGEAPLVCFLNTDTLPGPFWLPIMVWGMASLPAAGIVGPSTSTCAGLQKVALAENKYEVGLEGVTAIAERIWRENGRKVQEINISGFCFLTRRSLLEQLNGFDESFGLGYGEENDFELRSWAAGFRSYHVRGAYVHHYGKQSFAALPEEVLVPLRERNLAKVDARRLELRQMSDELRARVMDPTHLKRRRRFVRPVMVKRRAT